MGGSKDTTGGWITSYPINFNLSHGGGVCVIPISVNHNIPAQISNITIYDPSLLNKNCFSYNCNNLPYQCPFINFIAIAD